MAAALTLVRPEIDGEYDFQVACWINRLGVQNDAVLRQFAKGMYIEELRRLVGIEPYEVPAFMDEMRALLQQNSQRLLQLSQARQSKTVLAQNISMLSKLLHVDAISQQVFEFCALAQRHSLLNDVLTSSSKTTESLASIMAVALDVSRHEIKRAIGVSGELMVKKLLYFEQGFNDQSLLLYVLPEIYKVCFTPHANVKALMGAFIETASTPVLKQEDFPHLKQQTVLLTAYLENVVNSGMRGCNILIYGPPGTGKSQYVRWLAKSLRLKLYSVKSTDQDGKAISGMGRLAFYQFCQQFLQQVPALVLFDEMEDVFSANQSLWELLANRGEVKANKAWINGVLESNPVPTIWLSNCVAHLDPAYLRRFDFSYEMNVPPLSIRKRIVSKYLAGFNINQSRLAQLAKYEQLSPAQIQAAARILKVSAVTGQAAEAMLMHAINNSMLLMGDRVQPEQLNATESTYSLDYLNTDCDMRQLVTQFKSNPNASAAIALYGVSGAGKTAFAHYLAQELDKPILVRRASDILSAYLGASERNIAEMFRQAQREGAVLCLDEADSFLRERTGAQYAWQVSQTNELLTQMESFRGVFIASTNLWSAMDVASLRRFTFKIRFSGMNLQQRYQLFLQHVGNVSQHQVVMFKQALSEMSNLTPGDFATVRRRFALLNQTMTAEALLLSLKQECDGKPNSTSGMGFIRQ